MTYVKFHPATKSLNGLVDGFFNELPSVFNKPFTTDVTTNAPVNISETPENYILELAVPGRSKEDFKINIDRNLLTVSYEKKDETKEENEKIVRTEFSYASFKRTFTLDEKVMLKKFLLNMKMASWF